MYMDVHGFGRNNAYMHVVWIASSTLWTDGW